MIPRAAALALALGALACGDSSCGGLEAGEQPSPAARETSGAKRSGAAIGSEDEAGHTPAPVTETPDLADAAQPVVNELPEPTLSGVEARISAVLDADPSGDGLDFLVRTAREDPDATVREAAVIALGDSEDTRAIDALIVATEDVDVRVVRAAVDELSWWSDGDRQARAALERLTRHPDAELAAAATEALGE